MQTLSVLGHKTPNLGDHYTIGHKLGQGQYGTTFLDTETATGASYACKLISKRKLASCNDIEDVRREIQIMHHLAGHANIVQIRGTFEDPLYVHIVMDLCEGGELFDRIIHRGQYSERTAAEHTRIIVGVLRAIDFGLSVFFTPGQVFTEVVGSPFYVAPEVLCKHYGPDADVWTAGVILILYILLSGMPLFWAETQGIFDAVLKGVIDFESSPWPLISDSAKDLIIKMLCSSLSDCLTAHKVLSHPWIREHGVAPDRHWIQQYFLVLNNSQQ